MLFLLETIIPVSITDSSIMPKPKFWTRVRPIITEYLETTTIHGLRYLSECRSIIEKAVWFFMIVACICSGAQSILSFFVDSNNDPIKTTISTTSIQNVPFPAITIRHNLQHIRL